jgi:hypothetical protein
MHLLDGHLAPAQAVEPQVHHAARAAAEFAFDAVFSNGTGGGGCQAWCRGLLMLGDHGLGPVVQRAQNLLAALVGGLGEHVDALEKLACAVMRPALSVQQAVCAVLQPALPASSGERVSAKRCARGSETGARPGAGSSKPVRALASCSPDMVRSSLRRRRSLLPTKPPYKSCSTSGGAPSPGGRSYTAFQMALMSGSKCARTRVLGHQAEVDAPALRPAPA